MGKTRLRTLATVAALACTFSGVAARADDSLDRRLDEALRRAHRDAPKPEEEWPPVEEPARPRDEPVAPRARASSRTELRLAVESLAAAWWANLAHASFGTRGVAREPTPPRTRIGSYDVDTVAVDGRPGSTASMGATGGLNARFSLGLAGWAPGATLALETGARCLSFRDSRRLDRDLRFDDRTFSRGDPVRTTADYASLDADLAGHFVVPHEEWLRLDTYLGARWMGARVRLRSASGREAGATLETLIPMIGIGFAIRPVRTETLTVELGARLRAGGDPGIHARAGTFESEVSLAILFRDTIGVVVGHRFETSTIVDEAAPKVDRTSYVRERAKWMLEGPFAGVILRF